jgi:hypothetical protein
MTEDNVSDATIVNDDGTTNDQQPKPEGPQINYGFVVLVDVEGNMYIERSAAALTNVSTKRDATLIEVRRYAQEIVFDLAAQAAAEYTAMKLNAVATPPEFGATDSPTS